ncbi:MAG TPA: energy transducer TonB [Chitinophagaceae bacterium]|jgi:TonB family protein|nr:energy transducer TonB [Chitinophagaceae bacterium]
MTNKKLRPRILSLIAVLGLLFIIAACNNNNNESTKSAASDSSTTSGNYDTSMTNTNKDTSTMGVSSETSAKKQTATKKKGKATIGVMTESKTTAMKPDKNGVYEMTEVRPAYPGGQTALEDYITNSIEFPQMAIDDNKEGTVNVQFIIDENGKVEDAKVIGSKLGDGLDDEAVRVISRMPKWEPGKVKGKNVKTRLTLPVTYKIEE